MSFKATLAVAGKTYDVIQCHLPLSQKFDQKGKPVSGVLAGRIVLIVDGTDDGTLGSWMADPVKKQDGTITFYRVDQESKFKEVDFEGAYMMTLLENFTDDSQLFESLLLETDAISTDQIADEAEEIIKNNARRRLLDCQRRTGRSYCMLIRLSAEKVKIDGIEHRN